MRLSPLDLDSRIKLEEQITDAKAPKIFGRRFASYEYRTFGLSSMLAMLMRLPRSLFTRTLHTVDNAVYL